MGAVKTVARTALDILLHFSEAFSAVMETADDIMDAVQLGIGFSDMLEQVVGDMQDQNEVSWGKYDGHLNPGQRVLAADVRAATSAFIASLSSLSFKPVTATEGNFKEVSLGAFSYGNYAGAAHEIEGADEALSDCIIAVYIEVVNEGSVLIKELLEEQLASIGFGISLSGGREHRLESDWRRTRREWQATEITNGEWLDSVRESSILARRIAKEQDHYMNKYGSMNGYWAAKDRIAAQTHEFDPEWIRAHGDVFSQNDRQNKAWARYRKRKGF